ncbi:hypothetical protein V5735_03415 (plasmid) [Haladaptatus sp. SPP-AMP-3]|uniref:hypothetical protein n=1 Tax=Haladaptatus sp. SPP-AMP-3 TaxID=3121295 RepID=UPI003C2BD7F3
MSTDLTVSSKRGGETAASAVLDLVPELVHVPDTEAEHYDARASTLVEPSSKLAFSGICLLEKHVVVEIKSTIVVYGANQSRGRFYLRRGQHEKLLDDAGVYLFAVCEPTPDRTVIAMKVIPATLVDELVSSWIEPDGRATYAQLAWSRIFAREEVQR